MQKKIAIIGGGTAALYLLKAFINEGNTDVCLTFFEEGEVFGVGMPYSPYWANTEHSVNIACKELPELLEEPDQWLRRQSDGLLEEFSISREAICPLTILPRILFGRYQESQFTSLVALARKINMSVTLRPNCRIEDINDRENTVALLTEYGSRLSFDYTIIATGHVWQKRHEGSIEGYFDSPFPLSKLQHSGNHPVGILGASLSAVDAVRTLARSHGQFISSEQGLVYQPHEGSENFHLVFHSRRGLLPSIRYHLEHPRIRKYEYLSQAEIGENIRVNNGFLSLDYVFETSYKQTIALKDPELYQLIQHMSIEAFVDFYYVHDTVVAGDVFADFSEQLRISQYSEEYQQPIYWKEVLEDTIYTLNFHAKSLSAEDMIRLRNVLMPVYYHAVEFLPFASCEEILALHQAGKISSLTLGYESAVVLSGEKGASISYQTGEGETVSVQYDTFIDCRGQRALSYEDFPFPSLLQQQIITSALLRFAAEQCDGKMTLPVGCSLEERAGNLYLRVPGVAINDSFQAINSQGEANPRIYVVANAFIKGLNPDLSGIPSCNDQADMIVHAII